jgi:hypothetical protein
VSHDQACADLAARLCTWINAGSLDELRACDFILSRIFGVGRANYGPTDLRTDKRDFRKESAEELADHLWYAALEYVRREDQRLRAVKRVVIESPYAGDIDLNLRYLRAAMHDCFKRGEAPFASHGLYTQPGVLRDEVPEERELGIQGGFAWRDAAEMTVVYTDLGMSKGMQYGIADAEKKGRPIEYRTLAADWLTSGPFGTANWGLPYIGRGDGEP